MAGYRFVGGSSGGAGDTTCWYFVDGMAGNRDRSGGKCVPGESPDIEVKYQKDVIWVV